MAYKIKKTKEFLKNVIAVLEYLEKEWGMRSSEKFQLILDSKLNMLSNGLIHGTEIKKIKESVNYQLLNTTRFITE